MFFQPLLSVGSGFAGLSKTTRMIGLHGREHLLSSSFLREVVRSSKGLVSPWFDSLVQTCGKTRIKNRCSHISDIVQFIIITYYYYLFSWQSLRVQTAIENSMEIRELISYFRNMACIDTRIGSEPHSLSVNQRQASMNNPIVFELLRRS